MYSIMTEDRMFITNKLDNRNGILHINAIEYYKYDFVRVRRIKKKGLLSKLFGWSSMYDALDGRFDWVLQGKNKKFIITLNKVENIIEK